MIWLLNVSSCPVTLRTPVIVILTNSKDSMTLLLEADRQGLMNGDYMFFLVQHFEVSGSVVSKTFHTAVTHIFS